MQFSTSPHIACIADKQLCGTQAGDAQVQADARRIGQYNEGQAIASSQELAGQILSSVFMGTENSGADTRRRAAQLAAQVA